MSKKAKNERAETAAVFRLGGTIETAESSRQDLATALAHERSLLRTMIDLIPAFIYAKDVGSRAREVGSEVADKTAAAASQAGRALSEGSLTAKIKATMALDDSVKALDLDIDTNGSVVTISGVVSTEAERAKALQLAKETEGVTQVVDRMQIGR